MIGKHCSFNKNNTIYTRMLKYDLSSNCKNKIVIVAKS